MTAFEMSVKIHQQKDTLFIPATVLSKAWNELEWVGTLKLSDVTKNYELIVKSYTDSKLPPQSVLNDAARMLTYLDYGYDTL